MKTYWIIYRHVDKLSAYNTLKFTGDTDKEIENDVNDWAKNHKYNEIIDIAESIYEEEE